MYKLNLFTLSILLLVVGQINSTGISHTNQKNPASITYVDGTAPDELKAGPSNRKASDRRENVKNVLQRYIVTTGAPTIETVFESSTINPNAKSSAEDVILNENKYISDDSKNGRISSSSSTAEISIQSPTRHNHRNQKLKDSRNNNNHHFERYTNGESTNSQGQFNYESTTATSESGSNTPYYRYSTSSPSNHHQSTAVYSIYNNPILTPGVHSTSFSDDRSTYYNQNNYAANSDDSSGISYSEKSDHSNNPYQTFDSKRIPSRIFVDESFSSHNSPHSANSNINYSQDGTISTHIMESSGVNIPSETGFKQTHHIVHHQPISNTATNSRIHHVQQFTQGNHVVSTPGPYYLPPSTTASSVYSQHSGSIPVYNSAPTIQHIPVVTEVPVTQVHEHHGVIQKTINVPQHSVQTKTYEIRRPAIQKQFYDIEERVIVKPAGSVVVEIDQPVSKIPTGHVSTTTVKPYDGNQNDYSSPPYSPPSQYNPHDGGNVVSTTVKTDVGNNHYLPPSSQSIPTDGVYVTNPSGSNPDTAADCNHYLTNLHQANNVPHYAVPIGSAVTTTQTSTDVDDSFVVNVKHSDQYLDSLKKHTPTQSPPLTKLETLSRLQDQSKPISFEFHKLRTAPQMITVGEPDFNRPPYVEIKSHGDPNTQQRNAPQSYAANTLYTMQSVINNNLYNPEIEEQATVAKINARQENLAHQHHFDHNNQQQTLSSQNIGIAHINPISQNNFQRVQQVPKSITPAPYIVYAISPKTNGNFENSQPNEKFINSKPGESVSTKSNPYYSQEHKSTPTNSAYSTPPQSSQGHLNFIISTPRNAAFTQVHSPGDHFQSAQDTKNQSPSNQYNNQAPSSQNYQDSYSQVPAITYHIHTDQALVSNNQPDKTSFNNSKPAVIKNTSNSNSNYYQTNSEPSQNYRVHVSAPIQNYQQPPIYYHNQPCDSDNPLLKTSPQQFPNAYLKVQPNQQLNDHYYSDSSSKQFQNSNQGQNTQAFHQSEYSQQGYLPSSSEHSQNLKAAKQNDYQVQSINNQQTYNYQHQPTATHNLHIDNYSSGNNNQHQSSNNAPIISNAQLQYFQSNNFKSDAPQFSNQQEKQQNFASQPNLNQGGNHNVDQSSTIENNQPQLVIVTSSQPITLHEIQSFNSNPQPINQHVASNQQSNVQYFPPNNKLRASNDNSQNVGNSNIKSSSDNPQDTPIVFHNPLITVKQNQNQNSGTQIKNSDKAQQNVFSSKSPAFQIVVGNQQSNTTNQQYHLNDGNSAQNQKLGKYQTNSAFRDAETSPTHSYFHVTDNGQQGDSSISFHPLPSQSQSHILELLLSSQGQPAQPIAPPPTQSSSQNYDFDPIKTRVVSATPSSKYAKATGEKVNTRRIVVNQPIETVQIVEEQEPITTYKQVTIQEPTVYKTETKGVKRIETSVPVLVTHQQSPIYSSIPVYQADQQVEYIDQGQHFSSPFNENYRVVPSQVRVHSLVHHHGPQQLLGVTHSTTAHPPIAVHQY